MRLELSRSATFCRTRCGGSRPTRLRLAREQALGAVSTHDLPTVAGVASGSDLAAQRRLDLEPDEEAAAELQRQADEPDRLGPGHPRGGDRGPGLRTTSAAAPCLLLTASLDDALALEERPNMPGTVDEWPNWRLGLPVSAGGRWSGRPFPGASRPPQPAAAGPGPAAMSPASRRRLVGSPNVDLPVMPPVVADAGQAGPGAARG